MVTESGKCLIDPCLSVGYMIFLFFIENTLPFFISGLVSGFKSFINALFFSFSFSEHNGTSAHKLLAPQGKLWSRGLAGLSAAHQWVRTSVGWILIFFQYPPGWILEFLNFELTHRVSNIRILNKNLRPT
jgi:hypothetical protein